MRRYIKLENKIRKKSIKGDRDLFQLILFKIHLLTLRCGWTVKMFFTLSKQDFTNGTFIFLQHHPTFAYFSRTSQDRL